MPDTHPTATSDHPAKPKDLIQVFGRFSCPHLFVRIFSCRIPIRRRCRPDGEGRSPHASPKARADDPCAGALPGKRSSSADQAESDRSSSDELGRHGSTTSCAATVNVRTQEAIQALACLLFSTARSDALPEARADDPRARVPSRESDQVMLIKQKRPNHADPCTGSAFPGSAHGIGLPLVRR